MDSQIKEQNKALKNGLDTFLDGNPDDYTVPMADAAEAHARGLITDQGIATPKGLVFQTLKEHGMLTPYGQLSEKGHLYTMKEEDWTKRENLGSYLKLHEDGLLDGPDISVGDVASGMGDMVWNAGVALNNAPFMLADAASKYFSPWASEKESMDAGLKAGLAATSAVEGTIKATEQMVGLADMGTGLAAGGIYKMMGMDDHAKVAVGMARQDMDRTNYEHRMRAAGDTIEAYTGLTFPAEVAGYANDLLPKEESAKISTQYDALGGLADPTMLIPGGAAAKAGKIGLVTRAALKADSVLVKAAIKDAEIAAKSLALESVKRAATTASNVAEVATTMGDDLARRFEQSGEQILAKRANAFREVSARTITAAESHGQTIASLTAEIANDTAARATLSARIPEAAALATQKTLDLGRAAIAMPVEKITQLADRVGSALIGSNKALTQISERFGVGVAGDILKMGVGVAGYTAAGIPGLAVAGGILASGPVIRSASKFSRIVGKEMTKARGIIPFWQRVANYSEHSAVHRGLAHMMDTATLGGAVPNAVRNAARGTLAAYPINLAFSALADGGDVNENTFRNALGQSLVIGGSMGMLGGMFQSTKKRHEEFARGDEMNFRQDLTDDSQKNAFEVLHPSVRRSISTYSASNPQLNFKFVESGPSHFLDNTATINVHAPNPMRALVAHEVMHHVVIRNQNEEGVLALMLGDGEVGGVLRSHDGTLDPDFRAFHEEYNTRLKDSGRSPVDQRTAAMEYFVDASADHVAELESSGDLGAMSRRMEATRAIGSLVKAVVPKIPIIRDLHFKTGGLLDAEGRMVQGNGLLSGGIREFPEMRVMVREMLKNSSGRSQGLFNPLGGGKGKEDTGGAVLRMQRGDKHLTDGLISIAETKEVNGKTVVQYNADGDPIMLNRAADEARANVSVSIAETLRARKASGVEIKEGEVHIGDDGEFAGDHLGADVLRKMDEDSVGNSAQRRLLRNINTAVKDYMGHRFSMIYHPATKKVGKKVIYASLAPTIRDAVPVAIRPTKTGNLLVHLMSVTQLHQNIEARIASKRGKSLYTGNRELLINDLAEVMKLHRQDRSTTPFFEEKYGATRGKEYKDFVNTLFGVITPSMRDINPLFDADKIGYSQNVYKTYRWDRIDKAVRMTGDTHGPMPFVYGAAKQNLMPNGIPTLDLNGIPLVSIGSKSNNTPNETNTANGPAIPLAQKHIGPAPGPAGEATAAKFAGDAGASGTQPAAAEVIDSQPRFRHGLSKKLLSQSFLDSKALEELTSSLAHVKVQISSNLEGQNARAEYETTGKDLIVKLKAQKDAYEEILNQLGKSRKDKK
jgi:hypothetical protein